MKKCILLVLVFVCLLSFSACVAVKTDKDDSTATPSEIITPKPTDLPVISDDVYECLTEENSRLYLILPASKEKVYIPETDEYYLDDLDLDLIKAAENIIYTQVSEHSKYWYSGSVPNYEIRENVDERCLELCAEVVMHIEPSTDSPDQEPEHINFFFSERITN